MQLNLFDTEPKKKRAKPRTDRARFAETRRDSYDDKLVTIGSQKQRILEEFERLGEHGATIAEMAAIVAGGQSNRICQAIKDLRLAGLICGTDERRAVVGGKLSVVMVIAKGS